MTPDPERGRGAWQPRFRNQLFEVAIGAPIMGATIAATLRFLVGIDSETYVVIAGIGFGAVFIALYLLRFILRAPREIRIDEDGLTIEEPAGERRLRWDEVAGARHRAYFGLRWEWNRAPDAAPTEDQEDPENSAADSSSSDSSAKFILCDDGLSVRDWEEICARVHTNLSARGIEIESDAFGRMFSDDEQTPNERS